MSVSKRTRLLVLTRDGWLCQVCGRNLAAAYLRGDYSLQHRRNRGMGGSKRADTNGPANLLTTCGSATSPGGCHAWIEANPVWAAEHGYRISQSQTPAEVPVFTIHRGWVLLDDHGGYAPTETCPACARGDCQHCWASPNNPPCHCTCQEDR